MPLHPKAMPRIVSLAPSATSILVALSARLSPAKTLRVAPWQEVLAVRNRRVYVVRDELLNTPSPPLIHGARELFRILRSKPQKSGGDPLRAGRPE